MFQGAVAQRLPQQLITGLTQPYRKDDRWAQQNAIHQNGKLWPKLEPLKIQGTQNFCWSSHGPQFPKEIPNGKHPQLYLEITPQWGL